MRTIQEGMPLSRRLENRLTRLVHGPPDLVAIGMGNRCREGLWHFFYDLDEELPNWRIEDLWSFRTKHGSILVDMECQTLQAVKYDFDNICREHKGDYFWSVPLYVRISPKWDRTTGRVVSDTVDIPEDITRHFPMRKVYYTRD